MCGEFGESSGIIDLVIIFLAGGTHFWNSYDTLSYSPKIESKAKDKQKSVDTPPPSRPKLSLSLFLVYVSDIYNEH